MSIPSLGGAVIQNLKDAGCDLQTIEEFLALDRAGETEGQFILLEKQRKQILDQAHKGEKQIYCLDYLTFQLRKKHTK